MLTCCTVSVDLRLLRLSTCNPEIVKPRQASPEHYSTQLVGESQALTRKCEIPYKSPKGVPTQRSCMQGCPDGDPPSKVILLSLCTCEMAVLFYRCALQEDSRNMHLFRLSSWPHVAIAERARQRNDHGGFVAAVLFYRCALLEDSTKHAFFQSFKPSLSCYPQKGRECFLSLSHVLGLACPRDLGSGLSS